MILISQQISNPKEPRDRRETFPSFFTASAGDNGNPRSGWGLIALIWRVCSRGFRFASPPPMFFHPLCGFTSSPIAARPRPGPTLISLLAAIKKRPVRRSIGEAPARLVKRLKENLVFRYRAYCSRMVQRTVFTSPTSTRPSPFTSRSILVPPSKISVNTVFTSPTST